MHQPPWRVLRTTDARYAEILTYLQQDNFDSAYAVMDRLPVEFKLKDKEISEKDRTKQFIGIVQGYRSSERTDAELDSTELQSLRDLVENEYDHPAIWAQNLLCFAYGECRSPQTGGDESNLLCFGYGICRPPLTGGDDRAQPRLVPVATPANGPAALLDIHPNPASSWVAFNYNLQAEPEQAELVVRDAAGRTVFRVALQASEQQQLWDTRQVAPGAYTAVLLNAGRELRTEKLIVQP